MLDARKMPSLAAPFALIGLAAGWFSGGVLENPMLRLLPPGQRPLLALAGALAAAAVGVVVTRGAVRSAGRVTRGAPLVLGALVLAGGAGIGVLSGAFAWPALTPSRRGMLVGLGFAALFLPMFSAVAGAARRAARARRGSIVRAADRRAVGVILAATLAVATLPALLDESAASAGMIARPVVATGIAGVAVIVIAALLVADLIAYRKVARIVASEGTLAPHTPTKTELADEDLPLVDLGLGRAVLAEVTPGESAYRSKERVVGLVVGSAAKARAALMRACGRGALGIAVSLGVLALHGVVAGPEGAATFVRLVCSVGDAAVCASFDVELRCAVGDLPSCRALAHLLEREESTAQDPGRAILLLRDACARGDAMSCDEMPGPALLRAVELCLAGRWSGCLDASEAFKAAEARDRARFFTKRACELGAYSACAMLP